mmetsp:Transcript_95753/g.157995  ORF Transcript_95753/g.157995 Transcript_95753/m.157995 type:complete len:317 (+) Transcript_95753:99-1049(+)
MPSQANSRKVRLHRLGERDSCNDRANIEFDLDAECPAGVWGLRQRRIIRIMSVVQICFLLGFAHAAVFRKVGFFGAAPSAVRPLTEESLASVIAAHPEGILVNFHTASCSHCLKLAPEFEAAARELSAAQGAAGKAVLASLDAATAPRVAMTYAVTHYPTMLWFRKGVRVQEVPPNARSAQKIVDFVTWASAAPLIEFTSRTELEDSLSELRAALPVGGPPVIIGFSSILASGATTDQPTATERAGVFDALEITAERLRGETAFLFIQESWANDPSVRAYFWDAAADQDYNGTITSDSVQAWARGLLTRKPKKLME